MDRLLDNGKAVNSSAKNIYSQQLDFQRGANERGEGVYTRYMTEAEGDCNKAVNPSAKSIPVITIDGPSGTGKGTIAAMVADHLGWHRLDSGAIYRLLAYKLYSQQQIDFNDEILFVKTAHALKVHFGLQGEVWLDNEDVTYKIRTEQIGQLASKLGSLSYVREALLKRQRDFRQSPGLVTDGRDMGTVVFPDAEVKFFLTASPEVRAERRYNQLKAQGICVNLLQVFSELKSRDERDTSREVAPLKPADDAVLIDTSNYSIFEVFNMVMHDLRSKI